MGCVTRLLKVDASHPEKQALKQAARILRAGGLVAFPTETVYGLGADGTNPRAVERIFIAKGRPRDNPVILHVARPEEVLPLVSEVPPKAWRLMGYFWPGPLTLIFRRSALVPDAVTAGLDTVAIRMPDHPVALELIKLARVPVAAPSANTSGRPSPTSAEHVLADLDGKIEAVLDAGRTGVGLESTVLDVTEWPPVLLRPGGVSREQLAEVIGDLTLHPVVTGTDEDDIEAARSPGLKYTHYAPRAELVLVEGEPERVASAIQQLISEYTAAGRKVGVLAAKETAGDYHCQAVRAVGSRKQLAEVAYNLFYMLRSFDELGVDVVLAEGFEPAGLGLAIMNRLRKAATRRIKV